MSAAKHQERVGTRPGLVVSSVAAGQRGCLDGFRVAGLDLRCDAAGHQLAPFASPGDDGEAPLRSLEVGSGDLVFEGRAEFAGGDHRLTCLRSAAGYRIEVPSAGIFEVSGEGRAVTYAPAPEVTREHLDQVMLGPPTMLALAIQGRYGLHASAVHDSQGVIAFAGRSGAGKSTLARHLPEHGWPRIADDLLILDGRRPGDVLVHFPQPRLGPEQQPAPPLPERLPLAALCVLDEPAGEVSVEPIAPLDASLEIVRNSIATKLFDDELLQRHLAFATKLAASVPVLRLRYPRRRGVEPEVYAALSRRFGRTGDV